jgi:PleD family two-component response regulator
LWTLIDKPEAVWMTPTHRAALAGHRQTASESVCESPLAIGNDRVLKVTLSAGCSVGPIEALEEALRVANEVLYQAEQTGRNQAMTKSMIA